jgi:hypothetical protein
MSDNECDLTQWAFAWARVIVTVLLANMCMHACLNQATSPSIGFSCLALALVSTHKASHVLCNNYPLIGSRYQNMLAAVNRSRHNAVC